MNNPWEGVDGHLWLRDMVAMLIEQGADNETILYALSKPWKYVNEVRSVKD
jgi:hypothetical protein